MADIVYTFENQVYLNITNACPCRCKFCIRNNGDAVGEAKTLWFTEHNPTFEDVKKAIDDFDFTEYGKSVIFCGYGEPTCNYQVLLDTAKYLKEQGFKIRLNTNGLSDLINKKPTADELSEVIDVFSISLNAPTAEKYNDLCAPTFGLKSYDALCDFALRCKANGKETKLTVVDWISKEDIEDSKLVAEKLGLPLRVREYSD